jgi:acyl-coenzyme A thioesterase 13
MNKRVELFRSQIGKDKWLFDYPLMDWMNARVIEVEEGFVKMQFSVERYMLNPLGILHGGIAAAMLDELMGAAGFTIGRPVGYATINMNVDYLNSAKAGEIIVGEGKVIRPGKTVLHTEAKLFNAEGKLLSKAASNLIATSVPIGF